MKIFSIASIWLIWILATFVQAQTVEQINAFKIWTKQQGIRHDSLEWPVEFEKTGRGVRAITNVKRDELIVTVPVQACIFSQLAVGTPLEAITSQLDSFYGLMWVLVYEKLKGAKSPYAPYLDILPTQYTTTNNWNTKELEELQDNQIIFDSKNRASGMIDDYNDGIDKLKASDIDTSGVSFKLYQWASHAVRTRCFQINDTHDHVMVPFSDLLNHLETADTYWYEENGLFKMFGGPFKRGDEAFGNYRGDFSNYHMILDYGFLVTGNEMNSERLYIPRDTAFREEKEGLLGSPYCRLYYHIKPVDVLDCFRLLSAPTIPALRNFQIPGPSLKENVVVIQCEKIMRELLQKRPTKIGEDYAVLHSSRGNVRIAIQYRIEQKKVFIRTLRFCRQVKDEILPCMTERGLTRIKYARLLNIIARAQ